jgi:hypothetical protein
MAVPSAPSRQPTNSTTPDNERSKNLPADPAAQASDYAPAGGGPPTSTPVSNTDEGIPSDAPIMQPATSEPTANPVIGSHASFSANATGNAPPSEGPSAEASAVPEGMKASDGPQAPAAPKPAAPKTPYEEPSFSGFVKQLVHGSMREAGAGAAQLGAEAGHTTVMAAGAVAAVGDQIWDTLTTGNESPSQSTKHTLQDAVFNFDKNYVQPAIEHWKPLEDSGAIARGIHQASTMLAAMPLGPAGVAQFVTNAFSTSATDAIDKGKPVPDAMAGAAVDASASYLMMKLLGKDAIGQFTDKIPTAAIRRALTAIPTGDLINIGQDLTKKFLLEQNGNDKQAQGYISKIVDHLTNLEGAATNALFGTISPHVTGHDAEPQQPHPAASAAPPQPPAGQTPHPAAAAPPASAVPDMSGPAVAPQPAAAGTPVPDRPSGEAAADVRAQFTDMRRADTPRRGVLITPDTQTHLDTLPDGHEHADPVKAQIAQATTQGRTVDTPQGTLVVKTKKDAAVAKSQLNAGVDPQVVIGRLTGAGNGKLPDQTVVVQGREIQNGAVTSETTVRPEDQQRAMESVVQEGKVPVVMTPEGAVAERGQKMQEERRKVNLPVEVDRRVAAGERSNELVGELARNSAEGRAGFTNPEGLEHRDETPLPKEVDQGRVSEVPAAELEKAPGTKNEGPRPEAAPKEIAAPAPSGEAAKPTLGMLKTDSGKEVPVHIAGEAGEGKLTVHPLDENGEPGEARTVPAERVRTGAAKAEAATKEAPKHEPAPAEPPKGSSALDQLPTALAAHERQEQAVEGRKNSAPLKERQDNASAFAQVLGAAAKEAAEKGRAADSTVRRATEAAQAAARLTEKSKEDTDKGRGTGHALVTARVAELHKAARELLGKTKPGEEPTVTPQQAKAAKRAAKPAEPPAAEAAPAKEPAKEEPPTPEQQKVAEIAKAVSRGSTRLTIRDLSTKHEVAPRDFERIKQLVQDKMSESKKPAKEKPAAVEKAEKVEATPEESKRTQSLADKTVKAETPEEYHTARDALVRHIHEVAARLGHPMEQTAAEVDAVLHHIENLRDANPTKMSDTVEAGESEVDRKEVAPEEGYQTVYRPSMSGKVGSMLKRKWHEITEATIDALDRLGHSTKESGLLNSFKAIRDRGVPMAYHDVLKRLLPHADELLRDRITSLLERAPNVPFYVNSEIIDPHTGKQMPPGVKGLFTYDVRDESTGQPAHHIQVRLNDNGLRATKGYTLAHAILHEGEHAAEMIELHTNPTGPMATQYRAALETLVNRLDAKFAAEGHGALASEYRRSLNDQSSTYDPTTSPNLGHLYGIKDIFEMAAELRSNPMFLEEVIRSEDWKQPGEDVPPVKNGEPSLLMKIVKAIAEFMGYKNPRLALHMLDISQLNSEFQRVNHPGIYGEEGHASMYMSQRAALQKAMREGGGQQNAEGAHAAAIEEEKGRLLSPPAPVKASRQLRDEAGVDAEKSAVEGVHELASKSVDLARKAVMGLKTMGQIFRDGSRYFGHEDDETNPLRALRNAEWDQNKLSYAMRRISQPVVKAWMNLTNKDNLAASALLRDASIWKIDPRKDAAQQVASAKSRKGFTEQHEAFAARYEGLSDAAKEVFDGALESGRQLRAVQRRAAVDTAIAGFDLKVDGAQRSLLYGAKHADALDSLIGEGKLVDVGDKNEKLRSALRDWVGSDIDGPYVHLGREGDYVVRATPEGTKEFSTQAEAEDFARQAREVSPGSSGKAEERGGKWVTDYKIEHVQFHTSRRSAEQARARLQAAGYESPPVTMKTYDRTQTQNLSPGMTELMTAALHKVQRSGQDEGTRAMADALHSAYLHMQAQRSAAAGSRIMRKGFAGVKASEMRQNFANHASATIWHTAQLRTMFDRADALARMRTMSKDPEIDQDTAYKRGQIVQAIGKHMALDAQTKSGGNLNKQTARLGFLAYLTSLGHATIWTTQNFTTGIPVAASRFGLWKAANAFRKGMGVVAWPSLREAVHQEFSRDPTPDGIQRAIERAIASHPTMGKWAGAMKELHERGVISHGYANELGEIASGSSPLTVKVMDWARMFPTMADAFNRTSTALAGLELTGGDLRKTADLVDEVHADYSSHNKPLAFKAISKVPGLNSITMMKTYAQAMAHLVYGNMVEAMKGGAGLKGDAEQRARSWQAAKSFAGVIAGNAVFVGAYGAAALEPFRLALYVYHKLFDQEGEVWDLKNTMHTWLTDHMGAGAGNLAASGLPHALGVDVSERMGLANLFTHNMPDILSGDKDAWKNFVNDESGPLIQFLGNNALPAVGALMNGDVKGAINKGMPLKLYQDGVSAYEMGTSGKLNSAGESMTAPSTFDAAVRLYGLKPSSVADAQEERRVKSEYINAREQARSNILRDAGDGTIDMDRVRAFNERNPDQPITVKEIMAERMRAAKEEADVPGKNQAAEDAVRWKP